MFQQSSATSSNQVIPVSTPTRRKSMRRRELVALKTSFENIDDTLLAKIQNKYECTDHLILYNGATTHQYIYKLFKTLMHNTLTTILEISNMDLRSNIEIIGLALTYNTKICFLEFYNVVSNDALINTIINAMKTNKTVEILCMCGMNIDATHVPNIATMTTINKKIHTLNLNNNRIGNAVGQIFEASVDNNILSTININNNLITDPAPIINAILKNQYLVELTLTRNNLTSHQGLVSALITNTRLRCLDLSETNICSNDAAYLCQVLSRYNRRLAYIQLRNNHIDSSICDDLIELIENPECQLRDIDLDYNDLDQTSLTRIIRALDNNKLLKRIRIYMNNIGSLHPLLDNMDQTRFTLISREDGPFSILENRVKRFLDTEGIRNDTQGVYDWCRDRKTGRLCKFDHTIDSYYVLIEADGRHHFEQVYENTLFEDTFNSDVSKMKDVLMHNRSLIRVNYKDICANTNNWQLQLRTFIETKGFPSLYYIENSNEYHLHKSAMNVES